MYVVAFTADGTRSEYRTTSDRDAAIDVAQEMGERYFEDTEGEEVDTDVGDAVEVYRISSEEGRVSVMNFESLQGRREE